LMELPVSSRQSYLANYHVISRKYRLVSDDLTWHLRGDDTDFELEEFEDFLNRIVDGSDDLLFCVSDDDKECVGKVIQGRVRIADYYKHAVSGLLQSCNEFDVWMGNAKVGASEGSRIETILEAAHKVVFEETLNFITSKTSDSITRSSLHTIRRLHRAMAIAAVKSAEEGDNSVSRFFQKVFGVYP